LALSDGPNIEVISRPAPASRISSSSDVSPGWSVRLWVDTPGGPASPREAWPVVSSPSWRAEAEFSNQVVSTPSWIRARGVAATPSSSKAEEPSPRSRNGSSSTVTAGENSC